MSWILDWLPWWVVALVIGGGLVATASVWLPVWTVLPKPAKAAIAGAAAIFGAYLAGRNRGAKNAADAQKVKDAKAVKTRSEIDDEVRNLPAADRDKRLDRWMRDRK